MNSQGKSRYASFLMIPEAGRPRQIVLTRSHIRIACTALGLAFLGVACVIVHDLSLMHRVKNLNAVVLENKILKEKFNALGGELTHIRAQLDHIHTFATKLKLMLSLHGPQQHASMQSTEDGGLIYASASGASTPAVAPASIFPFYETQSKYILPKLYELEQQVKGSLNASQQESSYIQTLYERVQDHITLLRATPSVVPVQGFVSSRFGFRSDPFTGLRRMHEGIDIFNHKGSPIYAPADGKVLYTGRKPDYGNTLVVGHGYGITTRYGHLVKFAVKPGSKIKRGDILAYMGDSGRTTGTHLHYEVRVNEIPVDPENYILNTHGPLFSSASAASSRRPRS